MGYIALARKWRPRTFSQLVGHETINKALINSINQQRLHHAYLFTGTRGVGKTSIARLFAKAINCKEGISAEPCLKCEACLDIELGRFIDLIEVDGASRTRVEDTRELLENIQYAPTHARFKIYLIDEVHMLSQHSFNALLKALEEPPMHVKFLLATTEPQKLPQTVLSRCLQFNLKPLLAKVISANLAVIMHAENQSFEEQALELIAQAAKGSMRDALTLLEQIGSFDDLLTVKDVREILGHTKQDYAIQLLKAFACFNIEKILQISREIAIEGDYFSYVLDELLSHLHQIIISQNLAADSPHLSNIPEIKELASAFSPEDTQLFYQIVIQGATDVYLAPTALIGFEMILLRMWAFMPAPKVVAPELICDALKSTTLSKPAKDELLSVIVSVDESEQRHPLANDSCSDSSTETMTEADELLPVVVDLSVLIEKLKLTGLTRIALENAQCIEKSVDKLRISVTKEYQLVFTTIVIERIEDALKNYYQQAIKLIVEINDNVDSSPVQQRLKEHNRLQKEGEINLQEDLHFQELRERFSAELLHDSIIGVIS